MSNHHPWRVGRARAAVGTIPFDGHRNMAEAIDGARELATIFLRWRDRGLPKLRDERPLREVVSPDFGGRRFDDRRRG